MKLGVVFPQTEIGTDPGAVRAFAQAAEDLGYEHLLIFDHVLGADPSQHQGWAGQYSHRDMFHEPFVLFGYLAAVTRRIVLGTSVLILGQRQTALVAKQAAEADVLSGGRVRLGIGIGWTAVEYEALGMDFHNRGVRSEEQIALMRALWTQEVVTFEGMWHKVTAAGINPLPVQRPIPIWIGGSSEAMFKRAGRIADGIFPMIQPDVHGRALVEVFRRYARAAGRDPSTIAIQGDTALGRRSPEEVAAKVAPWRELGATHFSLNTMRAGLKTTDAHIDAIRRFKQAILP